MKPPRPNKSLVLPLLSLAALVFCALAVSPSPRDAVLPAFVAALSRRFGLAATVGTELLMALGTGLGLVLFLVIILLAFLDKNARKKGAQRSYERTRRQIWALLLAVVSLIVIVSLRPLSGSRDEAAGAAVGAAAGAAPQATKGIAEAVSSMPRSA
jgi:hypothetical protein